MAPTSPQWHLRVISGLIHRAMKVVTELGLLQEKINQLNISSEDRNEVPFPPDNISLSGTPASG